MKILVGILILTQSNFIFSQGKLYQVCSPSKVAIISSSNCSVQRVSPKKESSLLMTFPSLGCGKSIEQIVAVTGVGCSFQNSLAKFSKSRRLIMKAELQNSRIFGDIDSNRND